MRFDARLTGEAATLAHAHEAALERLPATLHASILVSLQKWATLFAPEQAYQRALLQYLSSSSAAPEVVRAFAAISRVESEAGCDRIGATAPGRFEDEAQALLRKRQLLSRWRQEIDALFQQVDPTLDERLYPAGSPRRLVVQIYGSGIAVQPNTLWSRFKGTGFRVPLKLEGPPGSDAFLRTLFSGHPAEVSTLFSDARASGALAPLDAWIVESGEGLHALCDGGARAGSPSHGITGLSYDRLRGYRDDLTRALYQKVQSGVASPQEFAAYARGLTIAPRPGALLHSPDVLQAFVRDVFLTGNGTLFVNNTFVEWAAVQAIKRAQPRLLVSRYGVRDKMKPFSSLLLFSQPRASDQIPILEDPVGSFVDVELLSYYVWLNAEKSAAYRKRTLYLFLAEGVDEMLAIRSDLPETGAPALAAATLPDVRATMAQWLGVPLTRPAGRVIGPLAVS